MRWLTPGGVAAALMVGGAVWWGLGWGGLAPLFAFLVTGSLLTRLAEGGAGPRTARQVLANGAVAACAALLGSWPAAAGAIAAATADTWATEIGSFSPRPPRLITTGARVPRGRSGGMTLLGTLGGIGGAFVIATISALVAPRLRGPGVWVVGAAGCVGMLIDSLAGATLQAAYRCPAPGCGAVTERPGQCHGTVELERGVRWLNNDGVNLVGSLSGAFAAAVGSSLPS
ncbi:MAG TPA: DUF92 domain-containing protein [Gemmatimonadales bacterium]